ncbi:MAG: M23 family metallopeptidase [Bacteroidota bacterium]|nr:M23 family metallopeptidase [Bacteroidota bacterium]
MAKTKYFFNPKTLSYEKYKLSRWVLLLRGIGVFSFSLILGFIFFLLFSRFVDSPSEKKLRSANNDLQAEIENINQQIVFLSKGLNQLKEKDVSVYRSIYETDPVVQKSFVADNLKLQEKYAELKKLPNSELLIELTNKLALLKAQYEAQNKSFDQLLALAKDKKDFLASIPAIQPVANKKLERIGSGFGYRQDPFYRTQRFHAGIDFTAPRGVEVYATADGVVSLVKSELWGYGQHIEINHKNGYTTLYAHLSKFLVKKGAKVKRGQLIGLVGSTGKSTAPHLHYEVHRNGTPINPAYFFFNDLTNEEYQQMLERSSAPNQSFD